MTDRERLRCECVRIAVDFCSRRIPGVIDCGVAMKIFSEYAKDDVGLRCLAIAVSECKNSGITDSSMVIPRAVELEKFVRYEEPAAPVKAAGTGKQRGRPKRNR